MKRACKTLIFILAFSMFTCLFYLNPVYAATTRYYVDIPYTKEKYYMIGQFSRSETPLQFRATITFSSVQAFIDEGGWNGSEEIDESVPTFVVATTAHYTESANIPSQSLCLPFEEISNAYVTSQSQGSTVIQQVLEVLLGVAGTNPYNVIEIRYNTLYNLGYRISGECQTSYVNNNTVYTCWLYTLNKYKDADRIDFSGSADVTSYIGTTEEEEALIYEFIRYDFDVTNMHLSGTNSNAANYLMFNNTSDYVDLSLTDSNLWLDDTTTNNQYGDWSVYSVNDIYVKYSPVESNGQTWYQYNFKITGKNPYVVLVRYYSKLQLQINNINTVYNATRSTNTLSYQALYRGEGSDLSSVNQHLVTIEGLLEDLQVDLVNNIYNDLTFNYDVDVQSYIENTIDDVETYWQQIQMGDPDHDISTNDKTKIGGFKLIFTNLMQTMDDSGIGILYFLPLMLLIIGALF